MKKVVIIGGGIAGLSAGIHALQSGYEVELYEKNAMAGGECTAWDRKDYHIDNCIHWLTGCNAGSKMNNLWRNLGALSEETKIYREDYFYMLEMKDVKLHLWRDINKAHEEFLTIAPEDKEEINNFFEAVKLAETMQIPCDKALAHMSIFELMRFGMSMADMGKVMKMYGKETVGEFANRFKNPIVRAMLSKYYNTNFMAYTLITSYALYTGGSAGIPEGGSRKFVSNIVNRFKELGGILKLGMSVREIMIKGNRATGILLENGKAVSANYIIAATDTHITFGKLLDSKYMDKNLRKMYECREGYPVTSTFHVSFGIKDSINVNQQIKGDIERDKTTKKENYSSSTRAGGSRIFPCKHFKVGNKEQDFLGIRFYDYDSTLFPAGKHVIQCNILQDEEDYIYWKNVYKDKTGYQKEKLRIVRDVEERIIQQYPQLMDQLIYLESYSPITFTKWCGAYRGAYMSFFEQEGYKSYYVKNNIKGLNNVFLASQWLQTGGGLPVAATSGKFAVEAMKKNR